MWAPAGTVCRLFSSFLLSYSEASRSSSVPSQAGPTTSESVFSFFWFRCVLFFFSFPPTAPLLSTVPTWGPPLTGKYEWNLVPISPRFPVHRALLLANMKGAKQHRVARPFVVSPLSPFIVLLLVVLLLVVSLSLSRRVTLVASPLPSCRVALAPCPLVGSPLPLPRHIALALRHSFVVPLSLPLTIFWQGCHSSGAPMSRRSNYRAGRFGVSPRRLSPRSMHTKGLRR
jgi:hypothetical protein